MRADFCDYCGKDRTEASSRGTVLNATATAASLCVVGESTSRGGEACGDCVDTYRRDMQVAVEAVVRQWAGKVKRLHITAVPCERKP